MRKERESKYQNLFSELTDFERRGVDIAIEDEPASPMQIVQAHVMREDVVYMRDYELNEKGDVKKLCFRKLKPRRL